MWQQSWLPRQQNPQPLSLVIESLADARVEILIDGKTRQWNQEVIDGIFIPDEAELIKSLPLSRMECEDSLFWPLTQNGVYACKSGYRFLKSEMKPDGIDENVEQDKALWRTVWSLQIPNKMKILMWRACRNSLPTKEILVRRTIIDNPICDRCKVEPETALHALWSCSELDVVWENASTWSCRGNTSFMDFKELMSWLIKQNHHLELFSAIAWSIWSHRNRVRMLQPSCNPNQPATLAKELLSEFMAVQPPPRIQPTSTRTRWQGPGSNLVKVNFDDATFKTEKKSGIGVVIRDDQGVVLASLSKLLPQNHSPLEIETLAASSAVQFASELGFSNIVLEGDSQVLMQALIHDRPFLSSDGLLIDEIQC